jgi:5-methyltetrahydropteroyltriglutamate--homocysteine methyltransferase
MSDFRATVVGSYPREATVDDTMKKPTITDDDALDMIRWAVKDQVSLGLEIVGDGEGYRENMYWFYQKRMDGITMENMQYKEFGDAGFGIECARLVDKLGETRWNMAEKWKAARESAPANVQVKQTVTGPHMLARFTVNERTDLYPDDIAVARAYTEVLERELREVIDAGCDYIQFDEPVWTLSPEESSWGGEVLGELIDRLPKVRFGLHVCGGNPHRKRVYFGKYTDMVEGFSKLNIDEVSLEHCTLHYNLMELWEKWDYKGDLMLGVIDQRSDEIETPEVIWERTRPALEYFSPDRLLLSSECGCGHVPLDITRAKMRVLSESCKQYRSEGRGK